MNTTMNPLIQALKYGKHIGGVAATNSLSKTYNKHIKQSGDKMDLTKIEYGNYATMEQLVIAEAYFQVVADRIKANGHEVPESLAKELDKCTYDLKAKLRGETRMKLAAMRVRRNELLTIDEKRIRLDKEIEDLEKKLKEEL